ncbi:hypothetical protein HDU98_005749 [Podochytrium sp. JEL0797]|nr:hypothetical protein HDU98_005749 [Podochytrium sp. JEL0797]
MSFTKVRSIAILVFPGVDDIDFVGPYRVLKAAMLRSGSKLERCDLLTFEPYRANETITTTHGLRFEVDGVFGVDEAHQYDLVIVPGGGWADRSPQGAFAEYQKGNILTLLRTASASNTSLLFASVCTGGMLLAHAGILKPNSVASTHHSAHVELRALGVTVVEDRVVFDGAVASSGGVTSGIDLALNIVKRCCGEELADSVAMGMEYAYFKT